MQQFLSNRAIRTSHSSLIAVLFLSEQEHLIVGMCTGEGESAAKALQALHAIEPAWARELCWHQLLRCTAERAYTHRECS